MAEVEPQDPQEAEEASDAFAALVAAGLAVVIAQVIAEQGLESVDLELLAPSLVDRITVLWEAYTEDRLLPELSASMNRSQNATASGIERAFGFDVPGINEPLDTQRYLAQARNRLVRVGDELWFNAREAITEGLAEGESIPKIADRVREAAEVTAPRARMIARTEAHGARNQVNYDTVRRAATAFARPDAFARRWQAAEDVRTRPTHHAADGQVVGLADPFTVGGASLQFPGDPSGPPQEVINCVTGHAIIQAKDVSKAYRYLHSGEVVTFTTQSGLVVTVSSNHPVLTEFGWIPASELKQGHHVIRRRVIGELPRAKPDVQGDITTAEQVFDALMVAGNAHRMRGRSVNFHGDTVTSDVDVVTVDRSLSFGVDATNSQQFEQFGLACTDAPAFSGGPEFHLSVRSPLVPDGVMSFSDLVGTLRVGHVSPLQLLGFGLSTESNTALCEPSTDERAAHFEMFRKRVDGLSGFVTLDEIVNVEIDSFSGHLYSFETSSGMYFADSITSHNCRCTPITIIDVDALNLDGSTNTLVLNAATYQEDDDMPWSIVEGDERCDAGEFAVVKDADNELEGCHATREEAQAQIAALNAAEDEGDASAGAYAVRREGWSDMPVAPADREWDGDAAASRIASQCGVEEEDASAEAWNCYAEGFLYRDDEANAQTRGAYKLGVVDVINGRKQIVPRGVFAAAAVLRGARGGADIPADQQEQIRSVVSGIYDRINEVLDTDHTPPWDEAANSGESFAADAEINGDAPLRYVAVSGPIVVEGRTTGDRRVFGENSLTWQDVGATASLEIPLGYQYERGHGPGGSDKVARVGRLDSLERRGNEIIAHGVIDLHTERGPDAAMQMGTRDDPGTLAGVSVIVDEDPDGPGLSVEYQLPEGCEGTAEDEFDEACMMYEREIVTAGARIRAVDLVDIPAFAEARLYLDQPLIEAAAPVVEEDEALTASSYTITIPELPPTDWFDEPADEPDIGAITVTDEGRIFGYLAPKHVAHRGFRDKRVEVPFGNVDYGIWMNRVTLADDGRGGYTRLSTGPITMDCGHAPTSPRVKGAARREHYDNACSVVATVRAGENARGVWIAGALLPDVSPEQVRRMMACQLSGDWGPHREQPGMRELAAALLVPVPGFPKRSFTSVGVADGYLVRVSVPVRFGTVRREAERFNNTNVRAAAERIAASIGRDRAGRLREFASQLREQR